MKIDHILSKYKKSLSAPIYGALQEAAALLEEFHLTMDNDQNKQNLSKFVIDKPYNEKQDIAKAFDIVTKFISDNQAHLEGIYQHNKVAPEDQLFKNALPYIGKVLNTYMSEFEELTSDQFSEYLVNIRKDIAADILKWLSAIKGLDVSINQNHELPITGKEVLASFIVDVITPATQYSDMIRTMINSNQAKLIDGKIVAELQGIVKKIDSILRGFVSDVKSKIMEHSGGKHYTNTGVQLQPA
jgi:hypothetical protein